MMGFDWGSFCSGCSSVEGTGDDGDLDLESKVVTAMMRLQRASFNSADSDGVDHVRIADFLSRKYCTLDGDIESQVITALQSGIKKGFICGLRNGNYNLIGPSPDRMIAHCYNSVHHGPNCTCFLIQMGKRHCCSFRLGSQCDFVRKSDVEVATTTTTGTATTANSGGKTVRKPPGRKRGRVTPGSSSPAAKRTAALAAAGDDADDGKCQRCGKKRMTDDCPSSGSIVAPPVSAPEEHTTSM